MTVNNVNINQEQIIRGKSKDIVLVDKKPVVMRPHTHMDHPCGNAAHIYTNKLRCSEHVSIIHYTNISG